MLLVASYVTEPPMCLFQFGGFMRKVWPEHWRLACTEADFCVTMDPLPRKGFREVLQVLFPGATQFVCRSSFGVLVEPCVGLRRFADPAKPVAIAQPPELRPPGSLVA